MADVQQKLWNAFRRQPSEATFRPLYESTRALVYTLCQRILRHEEDARDATAATYPFPFPMSSSSLHPPSPVARPSPTPRGDRRKTGRKPMLRALDEGSAPARRAERASMLE